MLTTRAPDGTLVSRPMALQEVEFDGDLWFFADAGSRKVAHLAADPQVNVTVGGPDLHRHPRRTDAPAGACRGEGSTRPLSRARATASARERTPSLR